MVDIFLMDEVPIDLDPPQYNYRVLLSELNDNELSELPDLPQAIPIHRPRRGSVATLAPSLYDVTLLRSYARDAPQTYRPRASDFEPIRALGRGLYGTVLLVRERSTGRLFAQKQMKKMSLIMDELAPENQGSKDPKLDPTLDNVAGDSSGNSPKKLKNYERTINEKSILALVQHPNIVTLYYAFQDHNKVYLILEYLSGGELFTHLSLASFLPEPSAAFYVAQIALALRYLHLKLRVIYRDLKPENCMLDANGNLVLTDFGLLKVLDERNTLVIGTAQYMAPEVLKGELYNFLVDWWLLGCVAFDMLTGSPPFTGNNNKRVMDKILNAKKFLKYPYYLLQDARDVLRRLLQVLPTKRWDVDNDFEAFKKHRFFRKVDWTSLEDPDGSTTLPPILPLITNPELAENFDPEFTLMALTPPSKGEDILNVKGFTYTNDSYLQKCMGDN